jgi:2-polyprenyl-3-methyl-5-hydroxy-6-metoxy-1,4-benzoquinol methylase
MDSLPQALSRSESSAKACDLCGHTQFASVAQRDRRGEPLETDICLRCGLVMHAAIPSQSELDDFYARRYRLDYHGELSPSSRRVWRAWRNGHRIAAQLGDKLPGGANVLEVGAGIGCTVRALHERGFAAEGIEPHGGFQRFAAQQLGAPVVRRSLEDLPDQPRYQSILLVHVIEHLRSPRTALSRLHGLLREEGLLYVECPNLAGPFATAERLFHYAHIHNFTPQTLRWMAGRCGFELVEQFAADEHPELRMLFRKSARRCLPEFPRDAAERTLAAAYRYGWLGYHLRPRYLARRLAKLSRYAAEHLLARRRVRRLLQRGNTPTTAPSPFLRSPRVPLDDRGLRPLGFHEAS